MEVPITIDSIFATDGTYPDLKIRLVMVLILPIKFFIYN
jgi:hypothetical protein